jgi:plasmid maintenance system killer protein
MIKSFRDAETEKIFHRRFSRRLPSDIQTVALRKLRMVSNAVDVSDLRSPPANRLEKLSGDRAGQSACASTISGASALHGATATPTTWRSATTTEDEV